MKLQGIVVTLVLIISTNISWTQVPGVYFEGGFTPTQGVQANYFVQNYYMGAGGELPISKFFGIKIGAFGQSITTPVLPNELKNYLIGGEVSVHYYVSNQIKYISSYSKRSCSTKAKARYEPFKFYLIGNYRIGGFTGDSDLKLANIVEGGLGISGLFKKANTSYGPRSQGGLAFIPFINATIGATFPKGNGVSPFLSGKISIGFKFGR